MGSQKGNWARRARCALSLEFEPGSLLSHSSRFSDISQYTTQVRLHPYRSEKLLISVGVWTPGLGLATDVGMGALSEVPRTWSTMKSNVRKP